MRLSERIRNVERKVEKINRVRKNSTVLVTTVKKKLEKLGGSVQLAEDDDGKFLIVGFANTDKNKKLKTVLDDIDWGFGKKHFLRGDGLHIPEGPRIRGNRFIYTVQFH